MSDKLTDITTVVTTPDDLDLIYIVDVSDTTDDPAGTSAKITKDDLTKDKADLVHTHVKADVTDFDVVAADIDAEASTVGQVLESDGAGNAAWADPAGGGGSVAMTDITDTDLTTTPPVADDFLKFDGTNWVPAVPAGGGGGGTTETLQGKTLLSTVVPASGDFEITIPTGYDKIIIEGWVRSEAAGATGDSVYGFINGDTTVSNYHRQQVGGVNGSVNVSENATPQWGLVSSAGSPAAAYTAVKFEILTPDDVTRIKGYRAEFTTVRAPDELYNGINYVENDSITAAFTSLTLSADGADNLLGELYVYGEKEVTVGGGGGGAGSTIFTKTVLHEETLVSGELDFSIPSGYDNIYIECQFRGENGDANDVVNIFFNGDTTEANYFWQGVLGDSGSTFGSKGTGCAIIGYPGSTAPANSYGDATIKISSPDNATNRGTAGATYQMYYTNDIMQAGERHVNWDTVDAITRVQLKDSVAADGLNGLVRVIGEKEELVGQGSGGETATIEVPVFIEEVDVNDVASIDFTGIAQTYDTLIIEGYIESEVAAAFEAVYLFFNGDTTVGNYHRQSINGFNGSVNGFESNTPQFYVQGSTTALTQYSYVRIEIPFYSLSRLKRAHVESVYARTNDAHDSGFTYIDWDTTDPVTAIQIKSSTSANITGKLKLSGRKQVAVGGGGGGVSTETLTAKQLIATQTDATGAGMTFAIPAGYSRITIEGDLRSAYAGGTVDDLYLQFNGDTTASNYFAQHVAGSNGAASGSEVSVPKIGWITSSTSSANSSGTVEITILDPDSTDILRQAQGHTHATRTVGVSITGGTVLLAHDSMTAALTSVTVVSGSGSALTGTLTVYGEQEVTVGGNTGTVGDPAMIRVETPIETITNATVGKFDFTNIPSSYDELVIRGNLRGDSAAVFSQNRLFINGDFTDTNYFSQTLGGNNGTTFATEAATAYIGQSSAASCPTDVYSDVEISIPDYTGSLVKSYRSENGHQRSTGTESIIQFTQTFHDSLTDPINRLTVQTENDPTTELFGELTLYGVKHQPVNTIAHGNGPVLIETIEHAVGGEFHFTDIPQGYTRLYWKGYVRSTTAGTAGSEIQAIVNEETTLTLYGSSLSSTYNGVLSGAEVSRPYLSFAPTAGGPANSYASMDAVCEGYSDTQNKNIISNETAAEITGSILTNGHYTCICPAGAMTQIRWSGVGATNLIGKLSLYGEI